MKANKPTIQELEAILNAEDDTPIEIMPNGEIRQVTERIKEKAIKKPLVLGKNLGGEYGSQEAGEREAGKA